MNRREFICGSAATLACVAPASAAVPTIPHFQVHWQTWPIGAAQPLEFAKGVLGPRTSYEMQMKLREMAQVFGTLFIETLDYSS